MTREAILEQLKGVLEVANSGMDYSTVSEGDNLNTDLGMTSIGMLLTIITIEESFHIRFDDVGFNDFVTVGDVIDYIQTKLA